MLKKIESKIRHFDSFKWGFVLVFVNIIKQIVLVPFFLSGVGKEQYSLWLIFASVIFLIRAINLGQLNYSSNVININYHSKSDLRDEIGASLGSNFILIGLQLLVGCVISMPFFLTKITGFNLDKILELNSSLVFMLLLFTRIAHQFFSLFYLRLLEPLGKISKKIKYDAIGEFIDILATMILIFLTKNLLFVSLGILVFNFIYFLISYNILKNQLKLFFVGVKINFNKSIEVIVNSTSLLISFIIEKLYENGLNIFITSFYSPLKVPLFSTTRTVSNLSIRCSLVISEPLMPNLQKNFSNKDFEGIFENFIYYWKITFFPILVVFSLLLPFIEDLYVFWTLGEINFNYELFVWVFLSVFFLNYSSVISQFFRRTNYAKQLIFFNLVKTVVTLAVLYFYGITDNITGAGIAVFIGEFLSSCIIISLIYRIYGRIFFLKIFKYFLMCIAFSINSILFLELKNYVLFIALNFLIILYNVKGYFFNTKNSSSNS
ncbi:MATE family efflux transporter [Aquimarina agarilytica]|uniref:polysaccharide biosynthesis protein n=1 Tax=Aquimarina agarilytica TaxID=1087449 RepID=UPI0002886203|nr:polysaccharide biosynthesis protein [Aquimarina agarilytica]